MPATANKIEKEKVEIRLDMSDEVKEIAEKVTRQESLHLEDAKIGYVMVYPYISKSVLGRCIRTNRELKFFSNFDYLIEVSNEIWNALDDQQKYILVFHELLHVDIVHRKGNKIDYKVRDHTVKEFHSIIRKHGIDWFDALKHKLAGIYDIDPSVADRIRL